MAQFKPLHSYLVGIILRSIKNSKNKYKKQIKDIEKEGQEEEKPAHGGDSGEEEAKPEGVGEDEDEGDSEDTPPQKHQQQRDGIDSMDKLSSSSLVVAYQQ